MTYKEVLERAIEDNKYRLFVTDKGENVEIRFLIPADYYEELIKNKVTK